MRLLTALCARSAEIILVEGLNFGVEVRHAQHALFIICIDACRTLRADLIRREARLTATTDATAAARHDFDEVEARLDAVLAIFANHIENLLDVAHLVCNCDIDLCALDIDRCRLDAFHAANFLEVDAWRLRFTSDEAVGRSERRFHNTTRYAEYCSCAGIFAEQFVSGFFRKIVEVDAGGLDHASEFASRQDYIGILESRGVHVFIASNLVLLGRARHDRCDMYLRWVDTILLGPIALCESGEHLLRGLRGREVLCEVGRILLHPIRPCRAAGREKGKRSVFCEALDELGAFFHDRHIGGEVRIEHLVEAEHAKSRIELAGREFSRLHAERFADRDAHRRSDLNEADLLGIAQCRPDFRRLVVLVDSTDGAVRRALSALDAGRICELDSGSGCHDGLFAASDEFERPDVLHLLADFCATSALDALVWIEYDRWRRFVWFAMDDFFREWYLTYSEVGRDGL